MTSPPLVGARTKLRRAKLHIETLRADIREAGQGEPYTIPLREELDPDTGTLYIRVDRETARPEQWGVLIGDAVHNLRSALDNCWWEMACHHLKRAPTEQEASQIQFPILKPGGTWNNGSVKKWVGPGAAKMAHEFQPDPRGNGSHSFHPLAVVNRLSNVDKHRNIHTTVQRLHELHLRFAGELGGISQDGGVNVAHFGDRAPKAGDELVNLPADSWARDPKVEFEAHQSGYVAIEGWGASVLTLLDASYGWVSGILDGAEGILVGRPLGSPVFDTRSKPF